MASNLLARNFKVGTPDRIWLADISYVPTDHGWLYLAAVKDIATMVIVGWAMSDRLKWSLAIDAMRMALLNRRPLPGLICHTDRGVQYTTVSRSTTVDGDHGRIETREDWPGLNAVVMLESRRELRGGAGSTERETRFYITSLTLPADPAIVRDHWAVENSLHWVMDMVSRDDECRLRTDHAPANP
jgi:hypothetical protein